MRVRISAMSQDDRGALVEERQEGGDRRRRSSRLERVRAHLNERMFPAKPDTLLIKPERLTTRGGAVRD